MDQITQVTSDALQTQNVVLGDGTSFVLTIYFMPQQLGWFINEINYQNLTVKGLRIVNNPNMLRQWKNLIPFGLACYSSSNREPSLQFDFSSGQSKLYVLSKTEVNQYEQLLEGVPAWSAIDTYSQGFLVTYLGVTYASTIADNIGNVPSSTSTDWQVFK